VLARGADDGRDGGEPAGDQPDGECQLEQPTGDGGEERSALDAEQLQQIARGKACVADETPGSQPTRHERGAEEQSAEEEAADTEPGLGDVVEGGIPWATAGVLCDRVSATVLTLNLPLTGSASASALSRTPGEPIWFTGRSLEGAWSPDTEVRVVRVCENPSVPEAAADLLGAACPPLVCTYGRPSTAAHTLLTRLHAAGVQLLVSADRDTVGEQIVSELLATYRSAERWLPDVAGLYEEERLPALLNDLERATRF
jgi:hypothetical protein